MIYRKLKRTWSHSYADPKVRDKFEEVFPELESLTSEEMCDRLIDLGFDFYTEKRTKVSPLVRLTLPLALTACMFMFISLPVVFIITGEWGYPLKKGVGLKVYNWFKRLNLA